MSSIRDIILLALVAGSIPICFFRPVYGVVLWIVMAFVAPQSFTWGIARQWPLSVLVAIPTLLGWAAFSMNVKRLLCREVFLMFLLWLWFTATTLNADVDPLFADKSASAWYRWGMVSKIILMAGVTVPVVDSWKRLRLIFLAIAGSFGFLVVHSLPGMVVSQGAFRVYGPENSMIADNNDFGLALNMALPFFFFLAKTEADRRLRWIFGFLFAATIPAIFFTYSRGALLGLIAVAVCMLLQTRERAVLIPLATLACVFAMIFTPESWRGRMSNTGTDSLDASALSRLNAWSYSWALAKDYPLMGGGFEAFTPSLFARYAPDPRDVHGPHSIYFGVVAEHGFTGLLLYLTIVISCFATLTRLARMARHNGDLRAVAYASTLRFALTGFLVSGAFLGRAYFDFYFTVLACAAAMRTLPLEEQSGEAEADLEDCAELPANAFREAGA